MLTPFLLWCIASLFFFLLRLSSANCPTSPFCYAYPECSRDCLGSQVNNSVSFHHSYGITMTKIYSTRDPGGSLADYYATIFACIDSNYTSGADGQAAWNQLVDDCAAEGFTVDSSLKPPGYSAHVAITVSAISVSSTSGLTEPPRPTTATSTSSVLPSETLPTSSSASSGGPRSATSSSSNNSGGLSPSAIAGITLGSLVFAAVTAVVTICVGWLKPYQFVLLMSCGKRGQRYKRR